jgi:hypothetical protein
MAHYFFNLLAPGRSSRDEIGTDLPNAEAAYLQACDTALELSFEMLRERQDPSRHAFEVTDAEGQVVFEIPFAEVTRPKDRPPRFAEIHASIQRNQERASAVAAELKSNFRRTQSLLQNTKSLLSNA